MQSVPPAGPVRLSVNCIVNGAWFGAGDPLPFAAPGDVPKTLRPFFTDEQADEPPTDPSTLNFQSNRVYDVNPEGAIITRHGRREAARLASAAHAQAQAEADAIAANELPPETLAALEDAHAVDIGLQIKAAEVAQAGRDADAAIAAQDAEQKPAASLHVKRGAVYRRVEAARLRAGETVYRRQPSGEWWGAGVVDATGALPPEEVIL